MGKISTYPSAAAIGGTELVLMDQGSPLATVTGTPTQLQTFIILKRDADQLAFERALSANGASFNGTSDDAPAIQAAINAIGNDAKLHFVSLPGNGLTGVIGSVNTCSFADPVYSPQPNAGLILPCNVVLDLRGGSLSVNSAGASAIGANGVALQIAGSTHLSAGLQVLQLTSVRTGNGTIDGGGVGYVLWMADNTDARGPAYLSLVGLNAQNASYALKLGSNTYLNAFYDCRFAGSVNDVQCFANTNGGECFSFYHCTFDNENSSNSGAIGLNITGGFTDVFCYGCSFDFLGQAVYVNAGSGAVCSADLIGCHFEFNKAQTNWNGSSSYLQVAGVAGAQLAINLHGGTIQQDGGGSGTQLPFICDAGTAGLSAPSGISLDRVKRTLQGGTALSNPSETSRFVDNP